MIDLLLIIILTSLLCNGLQIATGNKMILYPLKKWMDGKVLKLGETTEGERKVLDLVAPKWYYPVIHCIRCMPSLYGTILCLTFLPCHVELFYQIPIVILCSSPLSTIIHQNYA